MKNWLRRQIVNRIHWRYEVVGENVYLDPLIVWVGRGSFRLESGFYLTEAGARRAVAECPAGYQPSILEMGGPHGETYATKRDLPL